MVERYFRFQFINVYVSILTTAVIHDLKDAWNSPATFVDKIGQDTPLEKRVWALLKLELTKRLESFQENLAMCYGERCVLPLEWLERSLV